MVCKADGERAVLAARVFKVGKFLRNKVVLLFSLLYVVYSIRSWRKYSVVNLNWAKLTHSHFLILFIQDKSYYFQQEREKNLLRQFPTEFSKNRATKKGDFQSRLTAVKILLAKKECDLIVGGKVYILTIYIHISHYFV